MATELELCPCGRELHYSNAEIANVVRLIIAQSGSLTLVVHAANGHSYRVNKHYIALHGLQATELEDLAERGTIARMD